MEVNNQRRGLLYSANSKSDLDLSAHSIRSSLSTQNPPASIEGYGQNLFKGSVAAPYLRLVGLPENTLDSPGWTSKHADQVAEAVLLWARERGATVYAHWFQPLGSSGLRHGMSAGVQVSMMKFQPNGTPVWDFSGENLLFGETDGSSYVNGGMRDTHQAGGYLTIDPTSPIFLRDDTIFIPACLTSFQGYALDEKTPLLRSADALSTEGCRLLEKLNVKTKSVEAKIGLEQECFLINREFYKNRLDLKMTGRTVMGKMPPRGQEMCDHYMAPPSLASPAITVMKEFQSQCFNMGIPMRTRHREVAPNQYEFAPNFGSMTTQIDQNLVAMQIMEETAATHGLACLFQEKPFAGVNGSGKHNNWSLALDDGTNILNAGALEARSGDHKVFPVIMAAIIKAVNQYGDLMRMAIATPGNDFRLGACEAPPAIISTHLGDDMTTYLKNYMDGCDQPYKPARRTLPKMASCLPALTVPAEDRNRTSPFPYGGHRFEFRAVGSSQNVSMVNTVLASACAKIFKEFSDAIEAGATPRAVATKALKENFRVVFNGDGYNTDNQNMLIGRGLCCIDSNVDSILCLREAKNKRMFSEMGVFTENECDARADAMLRHYTGLVEIEAMTMVDMINQYVIPATSHIIKEDTECTEVVLLKDLRKCVDMLKRGVADIHCSENEEKRAHLARTLRLVAMEEARRVCDATEALCPANKWALATYSDLLFMDMHSK